MFQLAQGTNWVQQSHNLFYAPSPDEVRAAWLIQFEQLQLAEVTSPEDFEKTRLKSRLEAGHRLIERLPEAVQENLQNFRAVFDLLPDNTLELKWLDRAEIVRAAFYLNESGITGFWEDSSDREVEFSDCTEEQVLNLLYEHGRRIG